MAVDGPAADLALLDGTPVRSWLASRGHDGEELPLEPIAGGVSNVVIGVGERWVLKQSLSRLAVADEWLADPGRLLHEAYALRQAAELTPTAVPAVVDVDPRRLVLLIERAPRDWRDWRARLLESGPTPRFDPAVAAQLGVCLGTWHAATVPRAQALGANLASAAESFRQLRLDPFYAAVAARVPALAAPVHACAEHLLRPAVPVLVHGDYSPKNVLVNPTDPGRLWIIDFEVAHIGAAVFDLAFLLAHLVCKTAHLPTGAATLAKCAASFWRAYASAVPSELAPQWTEVGPQTACVVLARLHGKSPATYLTPTEAATLDSVGRRLLADPGTDVETPWRYLREQAR
jgi:aminoglycoside phosphotransferase (APT) family kinase protein